MSKKYNWGILGPGSIANKFANDLKLLPNASLYAIGSRSIDRAREFAQKYGAVKYYGSYEQLASDPQVDIVYIASPHVRHYTDSLLCLNNGKSVLCEKPVAMNVDQYKIMIETAKRKGVFFMEALWTRFIPSFIKSLGLINEGEIGEIKLIESDFCFHAYYNPDGRLFNPMLGGGSLLDIGIYPVFLALELVGKPVKMQVLATFDKTGVDNSCSMIFMHKQNILSILFSSIAVNGRVESIIHGTKGLLRLNRYWHIPTSIDIIPDKGKTKHYKFDEPGYGYQYEADEVMRCLDKGQTQSDIFSWDRSLRLITTLDEIRSLAEIKYPDEVERV